MSTSARLVSDAAATHPHDQAFRYPSPPLSPPQGQVHPVYSGIPAPIPPFDPFRQRPVSHQPEPVRTQLLSPPQQYERPSGPPHQTRQSHSSSRPSSTSNYAPGPPLPSSATSSSAFAGARPQSKKRASHNPSSTLHPSSSSRPSTSGGLGNYSSAADLSSVHPAVAAYQAEHPRRQLLHFGSYVLLQTLGEGEFGKVKLGVHAEFGEEVAVKLIKKGNLDSEVRASKVEREIDVLRVSFLVSPFHLLSCASHVYTIRSSVCSNICWIS